MGARQFPLDRLREPLLERVRKDPSYLVRYHAAESLLELADIYPRGLFGHPAIALGLVDAHAGQPSLLDVVGLPAPPSDADLRRFDDAANRLDSAITERLASGPCSKRVPLTMDELYIVRLNERLIALTIEDSIGSCERKLAFVAFLQSPGGFSQWLPAGTSGKDPLKTSIETLPTKLAVEFRRTTSALKVGSVALDTTKANVAVLSTGPNGVTASFQATQNLVFERHGRPQSPSVGLLSFHPEVSAAVRAVVDRSPELGKLLAAPSPEGAKH